MTHLWTPSEWNSVSYSDLGKRMVNFLPADKDIHHFREGGGCKMVRSSRMEQYGGLHENARISPTFLEEVMAKRKVVFDVSFF